MAATEDKRMAPTLFEFICFMVTGARGLVDEPAAYGPFRLIDGTSRLIEALDKAGISDPFAARLRERIEEGKTLARDDREAFVGLIDELAVELARELKRRRG